MSARLNDNRFLEEPLFIKRFRCFFQQVDYREVLGAYPLALTAGYAVGRLAATAYQTCIKILGAPVIGIFSRSMLIMLFSLSVYLVLNTCRAVLPPPSDPARYP